MSTHNIILCFYGEIEKIFSELSSNTLLNRSSDIFWMILFHLKWPIKFLSSIVGGFGESSLLKIKWLISCQLTLESGEVGIFHKFQNKPYWELRKPSYNKATAGPVGQSMSIRLMSWRSRV